MSAQPARSETSKHVGLLLQAPRHMSALGLADAFGWSTTSAPTECVTKAQDYSGQLFQLRPDHLASCTAIVQLNTCVH